MRRRATSRSRFPVDPTLDLSSVRDSLIKKDFENNARLLELIDPALLKYRLKFPMPLLYGNYPTTVTVLVSVRNPLLIFPLGALSAKIVGQLCLWNDAPIVTGGQERGIVCPNTEFELPSDGNKHYITFSSLKPWII